MPKEVWTTNLSCSNDICFLKKIDDLAGKTRFKCNSKNCTKLITLGESKDDVVEFKIKKVKEKTKSNIKLKF